MYAVKEQVSTKKKLSIRTLTTVFAGGNFIGMVLRLIGGVLTARVCDPSVLGLFMGMGIVLGYAPFLQLGVLNGLNRELPYYVGAGDQKRAYDLAATAQAWSLIIGGVAATGLLAFSGWHLFNGRIDLAVGWFTYSAGAFLLFYAQMYLQITYRTGGDFSHLAIINVVQNATALLLVSLVWLFSFYGLCLRTFIVAIINSIMLWIWRPLKIKLSWKKEHFTQLLKIGAPIFFTGQVYGWWIVTDSAMVLKFAGIKGFGLYQLAYMVGQSFDVLPNALAQICYPRMAEEYGKSKSIDKILKIVHRPIFMLAISIIPVVFLVWFVLPPLVQNFLPKYVDGVPAAQWMLCSAAVLSLSPVCDVFSVTKRLDLYLTAVVVGILIYAVVLYLLIRHGVTLESFPQAMLCGRISYLAVSYVMVTYLVRQNRVGLNT